MIRLLEGKGDNSPETYDKLFKREPDWQDWRRWETLLKYYRRGSLVDLGTLNSCLPIMARKIDPLSYIVGLDQSYSAIRTQAGIWGHVIEFKIGDVYDTQLGNFDYAVLGEVLEHLDRPADAVKEAFRILKPGGILAISVPLEEAKELGAVDKDRHLWSFDKQDIIDLVAPYSNRMKFKVLRSQWFPYRYCWPTLICWAWKK